MARFKYLGEPNFGVIEEQGPCLQIIVPKKDGSKSLMNPIPPKTQFSIGQDIGYDITDPTAIRCMSTNPRFKKISKPKKQI